MARLARVVVPGLPHHVTQRGNGGARTFYCAGDYALYRDLLADSCRAPWSTAARARPSDHQIEGAQILILSLPPPSKRRQNQNHYSRRL